MKICDKTTVASAFVLGVSVLSVIGWAQQAPDEPTIAFSTNPALVGIWLMHPDGDNQRAILEIGGNPVPLGLQWAPDGTRLLFHTEVGKNTDIYLVHSDGNNLQRLTDHPAEDKQPNWHPSGQTVAFTSDRDENFEIYLMTNKGDIL